MDITKMTDAQLRQLCEDANETIAPIERMIAASPLGTFVCPRCGGTATWLRTGQDWTADCPTCDWNAAGYMGQIKQ